MNLAPGEMSRISSLVHELCAVVIEADKSYLVEHRLSPLAEEWGCASFGDLVLKAREPGAACLRRRIIDAITNHETQFFRDGAPFDALQHKILPDLFDRKTAATPAPLPKMVRIWSAACSTGQEPYSIAMVIRELLPDLGGWNIRIVATDISDAALRQASLGRYSQFEVDRGMKTSCLAKYLVCEDGHWRIKDDLRAMVHFSRLDLRKPFVHPGRFDIIFCRNVAIYFTAEDRTRLFERVTKVLNPDGYLLVGATEILHVDDLCETRRHLRASYYQLRNGTPGAVPGIPDRGCINADPCCR